MLHFLELLFIGLDCNLSHRPRISTAETVKNSLVYSPWCQERSQYGAPFSSSPREKLWCCLETVECWGCRPSPSLWILGFVLSPQIFDVHRWKVGAYTPRRCLFHLRRLDIFKSSTPTEHLLGPGHKSQHVKGQNGGQVKESRHLDWNPTLILKGSIVSTQTSLLARFLFFHSFIFGGLHKQSSYLICCCFLSINSG